MRSFGWIIRPVSGLFRDSSNGVALLLLAGLGCAAAPPPTRAPVSPEPKRYRFETEGSAPALRPEDIRRDVDWVETFEDLPVEEPPIAVENVVEAAEPDTTAATIDTTATVLPGYRVQVFASGDKAAAESMRTDAELKLGAPVYVELVEGIYKVRVGDCRTHVEAEDLLQRCRQLGYGDAWIVSTQVKRQPAQYVPRAP